MKILEKIDDYLKNEGKEQILTLKVSPSDKKEIMKILHNLGVDYGDAGTYELDVELPDKKAAKKLLKKLPQGIRYTLGPLFS